VRVLARFVIFALLLAGCSSATGPALVQITGTATTLLREGDVLELRGESFPEGRNAEVTLRGEVARAGLAPVRSFQVTVPGRSASTHTVAIDVTRPFERTFSGTTEPVHATFHGSIEISFAPRLAGTPPVTGVLPDVRLDFIPAEGSAAASEARREQGLKFASFIGVLLPDSGPLSVAGVMPGSVAERAGVLLGDRLVALGGVNVLGPGDLLPAPRARAAELVVERGGGDRKRLVLDVTGFHPVSPRDLGLAAGAVAGVLALLLLLASPLGRALSFVEHRLAERLRQRERLAMPRSGVAAPRRSSWSRLLGLLPTGAPTYLLFAGASALLAALSLGIPLVARELDLPALVVLAFTAVALTNLVFGAPGERGVWPRARRALLVVVQLLPVLAAFACLGLVAGSFGPEALAFTQGALPWQWLAFRGPALFGAALLFFLSLVPEASRGRSLATVLGAVRAPAEGQKLAPALAGQAQLLFGSGALALAFCGGARLPGVAVSLAPTFGVALAGALLVLAKTWLIALAVVSVRWVLGGVDVDDVRGLLVRAGLPVAASLVGLSLLARQAPFEHVLALGNRGLAWACLLGWVVLAAVVAWRVAPGRVALEGERGPNPWI
jgi:hypothetical protein